MSGLLADGFEYLPLGQSATVLDRILQAAGYYIHRGLGASVADTPQAASPGRFKFGNALRVTGSTDFATGGYHLVQPFDPEGGGTRTAGFFGFALLVPSDHTASYPWIGFYDAVSDKVQASMRFAPNGVLEAYSGEPKTGTRIGHTPAGALTGDQWARIELGTEIDPTNGSFEVRVNTKPVIQAVTVNTAPSGLAVYDSIAFGCEQESSGVNAKLFDYYIDDLTLNDGAGASSNSYLGNVRVKSQFAASAGDASDFTPTGAATDWQAILNTLIDDTVYAAGTAVGNQLLAHLQAILGAQAVPFAQLRAFVRQDDATQRTWHNQLKIASTVFDGADHLTNQTFTSYRDIVAVNPATGVGMVGADLNGGQLGGKVAA